MVRRSPTVVRSLIPVSKKGSCGHKTNPISSNRMRATIEMKSEHPAVWLGTHGSKGAIHQWKHS